MNFQSPKGIIALDIDGTVTAEAEQIPEDVIQYFYQLHQEGWQFIFITGRPFQWGLRSLHALPFAYCLAVQNGACLLEMPSQKPLLRQYLSHAIFPMLEAICQEQETGFVVYTGFENRDTCYYRPDEWPRPLLDYLYQRRMALGEKWLAVESFNQVPVSSFASVKCFAKKLQAQDLSKRIEEQLSLHAPVIRDPFSQDYFVIQGTHPHATKGGVLQEYMSLSGIKGPILAAGDDYNDVTLLKAAQYKVAMANAPEELIKLADVIAPPAAEKGIIEGLKKLLYRIQS